MSTIIEPFKIKMVEPIRFTTPDEVAALVVMLASGRIANVTGSEFVIDGGLIKTT